MMIDLQPNSQPGRTLSGRRAWVAAGLVLALHALACWLSRDLGVLLMRDDARYLILATSLGQGGYHDLFLATATPHSLYPPGLPALLLSWGTIIGDTFDGYIVMNILLSVSALALVFAAVKRIWGPLIALACLVPLSVNPLLLLRAGGLRSETAYMFFSIVAVWALARSRPATQTLLVAGIAAIMATLTRTVGVTVIVAILALWVVQRRYRAASVLAAAALLTIGAWIAWTVVAPQQHAGSNYIGDLIATAGGEHPDWKVILWRRTGVRLGRYFGPGLPWSLATPTIPGTPIDNVVSSLAVLATLVAGLLVLLKRWTVAALYLIFYAGALMAYTFMRVRFVEPVIPLLMVTCLLGGGALAATVRPGWARPTIFALSLLLTASGILRSAPRLTRQLSCGPLDFENPPACLSPQQSGFLRAVHYISGNTAPDDLFMTRMPETLYYYTGRRSIDAGVALNVKPEAFLDHLADQGASLVLLTAGTSEVAARLRPRCADLRVVKLFSRNTILFEIPATAASVDDGAAGSETSEACAALEDYLSEYPGEASDDTDE